ncbi:15162_t:CDS:2, partial [Dentiscutata heterogama]
NNRPFKVTHPTVEVNNKSESSASEKEAESKYEEEELEDRLFSYSEEEDNDDYEHEEDKDLFCTEDKVFGSDKDLTNSNEDEAISREFYLDNIEEPFYKLDIEVLDNGDYNKLEDFVNR